MSPEDQGGYDYLILVPTILLLGLGLVAVYSASSFLAAHELGEIEAVGAPGGAGGAGIDGRRA